MHGRRPCGCPFWGLARAFPGMRFQQRPELAERQPREQGCEQVVLMQTALQVFPGDQFGAQVQHF